MTEFNQNDRLLNSFIKQDKDLRTITVTTVDNEQDPQCIVRHRSVELFIAM